MSNWRNSQNDNLFAAFLQLKTLDEVAAFCRDLMTEAEINEFSGRWAVAQALSSGKPQRQVSAETGVSIATVTRVNQWLKRGMGGYQNVIDKFQKTLTNSHHHSPAPELASTS